MSEQVTPAEVFPPGEYLKDELDARKWSQAEFAEIIGRSPKLVNEIIAGKTSITPATAIEIGAALGTGARVWLNLENEYRLAQTNAVAPTVIERRGRLRKEFPVRELTRRGWIQKGKTIEEEEAAVLNFYRISDFNERSSLPAAAKRTSYDLPLSRIQEAILLRVRELAQHVQVAAYTEKKLRDCLDRLRSLMHEPEEVRHVPKYLAEAGVRFVVCEPFSGSRLDGLCTWLDSTSPVIGMTLRLDRIDNFWFVLRHECEHILRGDGKDTGFIIDEEVGSEHDELPEMERAANVAAENYLVPSGKLQDFINRVGPLFAKARVIGFAMTLGVHPGIVVGQLQRKLDRWDLFRPLLVKVRHLLTPVAVTDGYGHVIA